MDGHLEEVIEVNTYIVIQRQEYFKLHLLSKNCEVMLGKDKIDLSNIIGKPFWTVFKTVPRKGKREFGLEVCAGSDNTSGDTLKLSSFGTDNRNIVDDGSSQLLSSEDINGMREIGLPSQEILGKIVENSKTFKEKTEFSQEKYLKKKEKKYYAYIIVRKPSIRLIADIFYTRDQMKILGLRHDVLCQILTFANIQNDGVYALFEPSSYALVGASILNCLSSDGLLINLSINHQPPRHAILGMNFDKKQLSCFISAKIKDVILFLRKQKLTSTNVGEAKLDTTCSNLENEPVMAECQKKYDNPDLKELDGSKNNMDQHSSSHETLELSAIQSSNSNDDNLIVKADCQKTGDISHERELPVSKDIVDLLNASREKPELTGTESRHSNGEDVANDSCETPNSSVKRKNSEDVYQNVKKPKWTEDFEKATTALSSTKLNGIIVVAKEYPLNIVLALLPYLKPSCPLVVYCFFREPLVELYVELKRRKDIVGVHLTENLLRTYQVLPERTHPDVTMTCSGHLLTAIKILI